MFHAVERPGSQGRRCGAERPASGREARSTSACGSAHANVTAADLASPMERETTPIFLSEHMKTHTQLRPPAQKLGWILGLRSLPSRSKDCARPGRLPQPMALGQRFQPLGVLLIRRTERRTARLGEPKCEVRGCHRRSPEPRLLHGVWIWKGPLQLPTSEDDPSFPRRPRKLFFLHHSTKQSFYSRLGSESGRCLLCVQLDHFSFRNVLLAGDNGTKWSCVGPRTAADGDRLPESSGTSEWPRRLRAE